MVKNNRPDNLVDRGLHIGRLGLKLTGSYLGYQVQNLWLGEDHKTERRERFQQQASKQIREELQTLKGPVMKLGQMLSMQGGLLSPKAIEQLAALQMHAPGMHSSLARAQFRSSCGKYPEEVFREFDSEPFAAAPLGQVHRGVTKTGETVAVKIQYPAIRTAVENDFKLLRSATVTGRLTGHVPKAILDEIEARIAQETNYLLEGRNLDSFRAKLKPLPYVRVPRVFWELTTDRVLTMSHVEGSHLGEWLMRKPSAQLRDLVGSRLFELFYFQLLRVGGLHADPHPGNYLFSPEGEIGLVDFGCVKEVAPLFPEVIRLLVDPDTLSERAIEERMARLIWGEQRPRRREETRRVMRAAVEFGNLVFPPGSAGLTVVDFGNPSLSTAWTRVAKEGLQSKLAQPEFVFIKRAEIGLYNVLHQLGARVRTVELIRRILAQ